MTRLRASVETYFNSSRRARQAVAIALILAAIVGLTIAINKAITRELDVYVVLNASRQMLAGADIYTAPAANGAFYLYLPLLAFLFIPLALLPQTVAGLIWTLVCVALIAWSLHATIKLIAGDAYSKISTFERWAIHLVPVILCGDAISSEIGNAQVNCLILAAAIFALRLSNRRRDLLAGSMLGFATIAKIFAAPLLLYELFQRRFRSIAAAVIGAAAGLLLPALLIGWEKNTDYLIYWATKIALYRDLTSHRSGFAGNASAQAVLTRLLTNEPAFIWNGSPYYLNIAELNSASINTIGILFPLVAVTVLIVYAVLFRRRSPLISYWGGAALAFAIAPLITPIVERPHFVILLPTCVYVSWLWLHERIEGKPFYALLISSFVLSTFTLKLYVGEFWGALFWLLGAPTLANICLIAAIFVAAASVKDRDLTAAQ
jgi:hypothetical protein